MSDLNLAVIGNCVIAALIERTGRIAWCCYPRLDGDPIFCSLLDGAAPGESGFFDVELEHMKSAEQAYLPNTAIVVTTLTDEAGGSVRLVDFAPRFRRHGRIFRPSQIIRRIEPVSGSCRVRVRIRPRFNYGRETPQPRTESNHLSYDTQGLSLRVTTDASLSYLVAESWFVLDKPVTMILGPDEVVAGSLQSIIREYLDETQNYWTEWVRYLSIPFEYQDAVIRAAITLKLCSFEETGAIVAALTTSIPEHANSSRNWDYRFCWLRDAYFVVHALNRLGATLTMEDYIRYITNVAALEPVGCLKPVYGIVPDADLSERVEPALAGYRGFGPVRVGNQAYAQIQNDCYGAVVLAAAQMFFDRRLPGAGDVDLFRRLERLGDQAAAVALLPDAGLWEFRGRTSVHTYSAAMCWAACRRLAKIAKRLDLLDREQHWLDIATNLRRSILEGAWNAELNSFVGSFGGDDIDASLLLLHEIGFVSASDRRFLGTVAAVEHRLLHGDHLFRYHKADDFGIPETAFLVCTFWYIDALAAIGRRDEARAIFERVLACRNHVGLLSEDIAPQSGELWGNFPQTYSMVGLIVCAMRLSKTWEEAFWRDSS
jgi:GH15 family glucan-1,4-alpha-glucosidase